MSSESEGTFTIGKTNLYAKTWTPTGPIKAKLIAVHGFSDHIGRYEKQFPTLASRGVQVFGWDQRGWGRSVKKPSERGASGGTAQVVDEVAAFIRDKLPSEVPVFVMGHSMGGNEIVFLMSDARYDDVIGQVRGWILSSPFFDFPKGEGPDPVTLFVGRLAARALPRFQKKSILKVEDYTRDPRAVEEIRKDKLCHDTGTLEGLTGLFDRAEAIAGGKTTLRPQVKNVIVFSGTADKVSSFDAAKKWIEAQKQLERADFKTYEGAYHVLHADLCQDEFNNDMADWVLQLSGVPGAAAAVADETPVVSPAEAAAAGDEKKETNVESAPAAESAAPVVAAGADSKL